MKLLHTADWHLGRMLYGKSLLEDQEYFIRESFLPAVREHRPDLVILAGDIYDRPIAPAAAIRLFDEARRLGLTYPYVYISYAKIYRKQKDYEKEIAVLEEAISRFSPEMDEGLVERKSRVLALLSAQQDRERELQQKEEKRAQRAEARKRAEELKALRPKQPVKRAVLQCNDDGSILNEFESVAAAAAYCGISTKCIRDAANGRQKHAGGFCWRYAEPTSTEDESI